MPYMTKLLTVFFCEKLESAQDKKVLAITSVIPGTSRAKVFQELSAESRKS